MNSQESSSTKGGVIERPRIIGTPSPTQGTTPVKVEDIPKRVQVPANVFYKMIFFSVLMLILPLGVFYLTKVYLFNGEITYSFVAAIVMVNLILTVYVIVAYLEEDGDAAESGIKIKNQ